jgi:hypothetical protein
MLSERRGLLFFRVLKLKRVRGSFGKLDGESAGP